MEIEKLIDNFNLSDKDVKRSSELSKTIDLSDALVITRFGELPISNALDSITPVGDNTPTTELSQLISEIIASLSKSDPSILLKKQNWFARYTGKATEEKIGFFRGADEVGEPHPTKNEIIL